MKIQSNADGRPPLTANEHIIEIQERGQRFFPRSDLVDPQGRSLILPGTRDLDAVEITDTSDGARIMALGWIGYLPLTASITLNIVPKFPIENLWALLDVGGENYRNILPTIRSYQTSENAAPIQMLARSFCHYLRQAVASGFERTYYPRQQSGYYRSHVEFGGTINQFISRGNPVNTVSSVFEFGLDSAVNQVIKAACLSFIRVLPADNNWSNDRRLLRFALETLQRVKAREPTKLDLDIAATVSQRLRPQYGGMLSIYHLLLTGGGISFTLEQGGKELPSFLFNLDNIFERFVRQALASGFREHGIGVLDGNIHQGRLFEDNSTYPTKPDIIFRRSKREILGIGEVKYKPKLKEADRYQIISHVTAAKAPVGILFTPANEGESQRIDRLGRMPTGAEFYHYRINIQGDINASIAQMIRDISRIF